MTEIEREYATYGLNFYHTPPPLDATIPAGSIQEQRVWLESDYRRWTRCLFPSVARRDFAEHHHKFWRWGWAVVPNVPPDPYCLPFSRGHAKSTSVQLLVAALGARRIRKYVLIVSETQPQADKQVQDMQFLLEHSSLERYYPDLATRKLTKYGHSKGWKRQRLVTNAGFVIEGIGLDVAARGIKFEFQRPDVIIFDDIDNEADSPQAIRKKLNRITKKILPAGTEDLCVIFAQNLIHKDSIMNQLRTGKLDFLSNRVFPEPVPAVKGLKWTLETTATGRNYKITQGVATWPDGMNLDVCEFWLNRVGPRAFETEFQHNIDLNLDGLIFPEYNELYHVVTHSEFQRVYGQKAFDALGRFTVPPSFNRAMGQDFGTTPAHPCISVWGAKPGKADLYPAFNFVYRELVRPYWPTPRAKQEAVSPKDIAELILAAETPWNESELLNGARYMSHEQSAAMNVYNEHYYLNFQKWKGSRVAGIPEIQYALDIDFKMPHPFRRDPKTGLPLMGCPQFFIIVPDRQGELYYDADGILRAREATDNKGMIRLRWEFKRYSWDETAEGLQKTVPYPYDNDAMDALRGFARKFFAQFATPDKRDQQLSREVRIGELEKQAGTLSNKELAERELARASALDNLKAVELIMKGMDAKKKPIRAALKRRKRKPPG